MKKSFLILITLLVALSSCNLVTVDGSGNVIDEQRDVVSFSEIELDGVIDLYIHQGDSTSLTVKADDNIIEYIETDVSGNKLIIDTRDNTSFMNTTKMEVHITVQDLTLIEFDGVGDIYGEGLVLNDLYIESDGVGDIELKGTVNTLEIESDGVGDLHLFELKSKYLTVESDGVGDVNVYAEKTISVEHDGVGDVNYKGGAETKTIEDSGVGSISKVD